MGRSANENPETFMNYKLIVRPEAEAELEEAFLWYEQQVIGLGSSSCLLSMQLLIQFIEIPFCTQSFTKLSAAP
jgi:hypothetical protein